MIGLAISVPHTRAPPPRPAQGNEIPPKCCRPEEESRTTLCSGFGLALLPVVKALKNPLAFHWPSRQCRQNHRKCLGRQVFTVVLGGSFSPAARLSKRGAGGPCTCGVGAKSLGNGASRPRSRTLTLLRSWSERGENHVYNMPVSRLSKPSTGYRGAVFSWKQARRSRSPPFL